VRCVQEALDLRLDLGLVRKIVRPGSGRNRETSSFASGVRQDLPRAKEATCFDNAEEKHEERYENNGTLNRGDAFLQTSVRLMSADTHNATVWGQLLRPL
jgi:hypothetical protein